MMRFSLSRSPRAAGRGFRAASGARAPLRQLASTPIHISQPTWLFTAGRLLSTSFSYQGITPDDEPPANVEETKVLRTPAQISDGIYHGLADAYMEELLKHCEKIQDEREGVELDYAGGVLTLQVPDVGTYVINKQPPNKQIWLSSPISGPKRYDYVIQGDSMNDKQGTAVGVWMYLRNNSTMDDLFREELGVDIRMPDGDYGS